MIKTRMAPSPTGEYHIGHIRTVLYNYAFAKKNNGKFVIRIEDTDRERFVEGASDRILQVIKDYGFSWDEGPSFQSQRLEIYKKHALELIEKGNAYYCFCSEERLTKLREDQKAKGMPSTKYDKKCLLLSKDEVKSNLNEGLKYVIRLNVKPNEVIKWKDEVFGEIEINSNDLDDQVLLKSDGFPTYHLAVVVDDHLMEITHVIRAEDWISSTPKHILLFRYFGWQLPVFVHGPLLRNPDQSKLSKRKNPVWVSWYKEQGFLPEAVLHYLALMGWSHPDGKDIFSESEFIDKFNLEDLKAVGPAFDLTKLEWLNGEYIRKSQNSKLKSQIRDFYQ